MTTAGLLIRPTVTVSLRNFSSDFIDEMVAADTLKQGEAEQMLKAWNQ